MPKKKERTAPATASYAAPERKAPLIPRKQPQPQQAKRDVAFSDGGMDDDSDDDLPLVARRKAAA